MIYIILHPDRIYCFTEIVNSCLGTNGLCKPYNIICSEQKKRIFFLFGQQLEEKIYKVTLYSIYLFEAVSYQTLHYFSQIQARC